MKFKNMKNFRIPMNLQFFAENDGDGNNDGDGEGEGTEGEKNEPMSFDEFLKLEGNQAEFDRRIQKATNTAVNNAQTKWKAMHDDKLSEAEKLAQMTAEEKMAYENKKLKQELESMKRQGVRTDLAREARKMLADEEINITDDLLEHLITDDADNTKSAVQSFTKLFKDAVQTAVKNALKGNTPKSGGKNTITRAQIMEVKDPIERQKLIAENISLFQ